MESFHIPKSDIQNCRESYEFSPEDLANIPCPDENYEQVEGSLLEDDVELPLPPGTSVDDFPIPLPPKQESFYVSNNFSPSLSQNKAFENISNLGPLLAPENFNILALDEDSQQKYDQKTEEFQEDVASKSSEFLDDSKYSPSKVDSDEENQDFITIKPKVLGKEQAKKRLMAFSVIKQPSTSVKKPSKMVTPAKNKEKPPNPNKGSNVQEQFRATISAIEEEKKKMFQNMPSYLLSEMSELTKSSQSSMSSSNEYLEKIKLLEKLKKENTDSKNKNNSGKDKGSSNERVRSKRSHKSRSKSRSKSQRRRQNESKRRNRSRSRSKRSSSRNRRRNHSRSRRSRSRNRKFREEKTFKTDKTLRENQSVSKKKVFEDWSSFKAAGLNMESKSWLSKNRPDDSKLHRDEPYGRSRSPNDKGDFKPIFNYLNKGYSLMTSLQAKPADPGNSAPVLFSEKIIKYTRTKPILCWAENPAHALEYCMSKQMLLENCDQVTSSILRYIMENNSVIPSENEDILETHLKSRPWYPSGGCLVLNAPKGLKTEDSNLFKKSLDMEDKIIEESQTEVFENKQEIVTEKEEKKKGKTSPGRKISLVNDSYLSDEEDQVKEVIVGDVKVQLDLDMNSVKVRSKWDSDYEGDNSEKESILNKNRDETSNKIQVEKSVSNDFDIAPCQPLNDSSEEKKLPPCNLFNLNTSHIESPSLEIVSDTNTGNLVSEYEEFLKMVSADPSDNFENEKMKMVLECKPKTSEKIKIRKQEKPKEEKEVQNSKLEFTNWDQESSHEEKSNSKKMQFIGSHDEFLILGKNERSDVKIEKSKKKPRKKKTEKLKSKKKKFEKFIKKKKKHKDSFSEDSTSESYESDSESDSDESTSSRKRKTIAKAKKKSRKNSSSESDSDSGDSKIKKKKHKKSGKKNRSSSSDDTDEEVQNVLLKHLDFKKQLIMKKIEEIDSISDRSIKKKEKEGRGKKRVKESSEETSSEKYSKLGKKKKTEIKAEKKKLKISSKKSKTLAKNKKLKKSRSSTESESESSEESFKKKKTKKAGKRKRDSSESSDDEEKPAKLKSKSSRKTSKKTKAKWDSSSADSDDTEGSSGDGKKTKKKGSKLKSDDEKFDKSFKESLLLKEIDSKPEERSVWESKKLWKKPEGKDKKKKQDDDWEASSTVEESDQECRTRESSWDEEVVVRGVKHQLSEDSVLNTDKMNDTITAEKDLNENNSTNLSEANNQLASETLKTSLSNFSFNENSFCSFGQELSRDFFLAERSYSNSENVNNGELLRTNLIEARPFQSVSKDSEIKKPADSELYSPGYSDSEISEAETQKSEKTNANSNVENVMRNDFYDPLNCDSEENDNKLSSIPLPHASDIVLPNSSRNFEHIGVGLSSNSENSILKDFSRNQSDISGPKLLSSTSPLKSCFISSDFTPVAASQFSLNDEKNTPTKKQLMSVKGQQKLISKAASVFQDESDEENIESLKKITSENILSEALMGFKEKADENMDKSLEKPFYAEDKIEAKKRKKESRDSSRERSNEREERRRRSRSQEKKDRSKKASSPSKKRKSRTPELTREKREIRSDSFEIEPLKCSIDSNELTEMVQPIPVLTGLEATSSELLWNRSLALGCEFPQATDNLIDHVESFDIYPPEESKFRNRNYEKEYVGYERVSVETSRDGKSKKERRKSRSRSYSPRKKLRSKSPERRKSPKSRSPRRKSVSPKRRDKSPFSFRRRSPKRKSPSRKYKSSRSPDKKRKSLSRSPRKRRGSPSRRSRSVSPRKYRSPKYRDESPRRKDSPTRAFSPRDRYSPKSDMRFSQSYTGGLQNRIPVIGTSVEDADMELNTSTMRSPMFENSISFGRQMTDTSATEAEMYNSFYEGEYTDEFGVSGYSEEVGVNNLITVKNHDIEKPNSPERLSLDQRIELELNVTMSGSQVQGDQYQMANQVCPPFQEINSNHFQNSYNCDNSNISNDNFYQNTQINSDFNGQYFNGHQQQPPHSYGSFHQYSQPVQNSVLQVGNIVEVVPTLQHTPIPPQHLPSKTPQIMQVGNVLQVVPSQKTSPVPPPSHNYGTADASPVVKTQKATAVVAPSSVVPTPNPEAVLSPLIKAIQLEREKRGKEKEKRKAEREARRKARQLRREAKLMSVNEKLKKSVQNEGLMLGQEVEDDELLDGLDVPSPPVPVEIITVSSPSALPPAGKGILITAGFMPKPPSEKKEVKFADGVCPGEGTSTSGDEDVASPPPKPKLPKEKRFKKKKIKVKKKVKVQIIRQIIQEGDDDEDDLSPPPPPPGDPPPVFFARFPFVGDAQFPVYQTQTTTTTLTTVQYPAQSFE